jgi:hypothetical protein
VVPSVGDPGLHRLLTDVTDRIRLFIRLSATSEQRLRCHASHFIVEIDGSYYTCRAPQRGV